MPFISKVTNETVLVSLAFNSGPDVKILLTLDTERYASNFYIGGKLGQCCI